MPASTFFGIDLSAAQIADGQKTAAARGLTNIQLKVLNILDVDESLGRFDYIVCHGVYSWVPPAVQDKIFDICATQMTPNGIAFISYNTYPGWFIKKVVRDMIYYHASQFAEPLERVRQARWFLEYLARSVVPESTSSYEGNLHSAAVALREQSDSYLLHEFLDDFVQPIYFHEFAAKAAAWKLRYVADARIPPMYTADLSPEAIQTLGQLTHDPIRSEQYLDFLSPKPAVPREPESEPEASAGSPDTPAVRQTPSHTERRMMLAVLSRRGSWRIDARVGGHSQGHACGHGIFGIDLRIKARNLRPTIGIVQSVPGDFPERLTVLRNHIGALGWARHSCLAR